LERSCASAIAAVSKIAPAAKHASSEQAALRPLKEFDIRLMLMAGQIDFRAAALRHCPTAFAPGTSLGPTGGKNEECRFA
jgi:hypothetical protein